MVGESFGVRAEFVGWQRSKEVGDRHRSPASSDWDGPRKGFSITTNNKSLLNRVPIQPGQPRELELRIDLNILCVRAGQVVLSHHHHLLIGYRSFSQL